MKNIEAKITEALKAVNPKNDASIQEAVGKILEADVKSGSKVAVIDDPSYSHMGVGKVKGSPANGFVEVEFDNGATVQCAVSLLIPV